jgi:hypothetical protein
LTVTDAVGRGGDVEPRRLARAVTSAWLRFANIAELSADWDELKPLMDLLRAVSHEMDERVGNSPSVVPSIRDYNRSSDWARSPWSGIGRTSAGFGARDLAPLVAARGMPMVMPAMKYEDITAAEHVVKPSAFRTLMQAQMVDGYRALMKLHLPDARKLAMTTGSTRKARQVSESVRRLMPDDSLRPRTKLAGMGLFNFAGFLSRGWRSNDWWWGRIDAAHGIIDVLETFGSFSTDPYRDASERAVRRRVSAENAVIDQWRTATDATDAAGRAAFRASVGSQTGGVAALSPNYRLAVASRLLRLASQAVTRGAGALSPRRVLQWILRPLLVFLPLAVAPARLALVAALLAAPFLAFLPSMTMTFGAGVVGAAFLIVIVGVLCRVVVERLLRFAALDRALDDNRRAYLEKPLARSAWTGGILAILSLALAATVATHSIVLLQTGPVTWVLLIAALALALLTQRRFLVPTMKSGRSPLPAMAAVAFAGVIAAAAWLAQPLEQVQAVATDVVWRAIIAASIGALLAWVLTYGWRFGFARGPKLIPALQSFLIGMLAAVAAGIPWLVPVFAPLDWVSWIYPAILGFWLWGTVVWWLPAIWGSEYRPSDSPARRPMPDLAVPR